jgi:hypothetical protein
MEPEFDYNVQKSLCVGPHTELDESSPHYLILLL